MALKDHNTLKGLAFLSPWLIGFVAFMALPIGLSFYYSLSVYPLYDEPAYVGADNYAQLLWEPDGSGGYGDALFWKSLKNTGYFALLSLPAMMIVSLGLALLLNTRVAGLSIYRTIIFLPSIIPIMAAAMVFLLFADSQDGVLNAMLAKIGIDGPDWLGSEAMAMPSLALLSVWGVGHTVVIYLAGLQDVPASLYEAAEIDGAGAWSKLWHVTLPCISPVIFFNLIIAIIGTVQYFLQPYVITNGGPSESTYVLTMYLYDKAFQYHEFGYASAMAWIMFVIILVLTGLAFWTSKRWVHYQGE